ncbi:glycoside hydrolase family 20 zincin-like fold domain-containing protein, partial [Microbacterium sp. LB16]|uniref:glycoside hydrolase family 20 zincin-like fold domain-containing protein n=1 Tax=Microbacterium sp. LB16 TaxID=3081271 RepID=UPI003FA5E6B0
QDDRLDEEGFELTVTPAGVRIGAAVERGAHWAAQPLLQLFPATIHRRAPLPSTVPWRAPAREIRDSPR